VAASGADAACAGLLTANAVPICLEPGDTLVIALAEVTGTDVANLAGVVVLNEPATVVVVEGLASGAVDVGCGCLCVVHDYVIPNQHEKCNT
jgi:hypothetical protein